MTPIWGEARTGVELARLVRDPIYRRSDPDTGGGRPVVLVPGFLAGDGSLATMTRWLRRSGYHTHRAGMRLNVACSARAVDMLERGAERHAERHGQAVAVIGQSRGGVLGRALAVRRPDLVDTLITLGAPLLRPLDVHPLVLAQVGLIGALGTAGVPGLFGLDCLRGPCCRDFRDSFAEPVPDGIRFVSVYSRSDGIMDWHSCLDPGAEHVEVQASHIGMAVSAPVYRAVAEALVATEAPALAVAA